MKKILLCSDGSDYSQVALHYAGWLLQRAEDCAIEVLYVTDLRQFEVPVVADLSGGLGMQPYQEVLSQLQALEKDKAALIEKNARRILGEEGVDGERITFSHRTGLLVDTLESLQAEADLILLGKRGENANFAAGHLGSNMERVVRASKKPCLVTSRAFQPFGRLLIAYDGSESCQTAAKFLAGSAVFGALELHVVVVAEHKGQDEATRRLREAEAYLQEGGREPVCEMLHGVVEPAIASYVDEQKIDLLVLGAYGHSRIRQLFIGSTTTEMMRSCRVPVLCFR